MKKSLVLSVCVAIISVVWLIAVGAAQAIVSAAVYIPQTGDLIKTANNPAIYLIDSDYKRHLFVNAATFWTWYNGTWSDQTIKVISQDDFEKIKIGADKTARPGINLVKFSNSPRVYAVTTGAVLREVVSSSGNDQAARALYGANYASRIIIVQESFESDYTKGEALTASSELPDGSLFKYAGSNDVYLVDGVAKVKLSAESFSANGYKSQAVISGVVSSTVSVTHPNIEPVEPVKATTETVKCIFSGTSAGQSCYSGADGCSTPADGTATICSATMSGTAGISKTWKSSCGGYASTILDGTDETITFDCTKPNRQVVVASAPVTTVVPKYDAKYDIDGNNAVETKDYQAVFNCYLGKCDINGNGAITPEDATIIMAHINGGGAYDAKYDINGDSQVDTLDYMSVFNCYLGKCDINADGAITPGDALLIASFMQ